MSAIPGVMKLYAHHCDCIGSERFADGTAFVIQNCDGELVFEHVEVDDRPTREARLDEATTVIAAVRRAIGNENKLYALRDSIRAALGAAAFDEESE
jgi:hypothetical protein